MPQAHTGPKNYVFMLGDGFGPAHITLSRLVSQRDSLFMEKELRGTVRTRSSSSTVTDSAAGATAYSCAQKTYNGAIGVSHDRVPLGTVAEAAKRNGMPVGLVTTTRVTHATPASFSAHVDSRYSERYVASQQIRQGFDVIFGGGMRVYDQPAFLNNGSFAPHTVLEEAVQMGYHVARNEKELDSAQIPVLGLFASSHMSFEIDRVKENEGLPEGEGQPSLSKMTKKAMELLSARAKATGAPGFFLLVEGGRIDHAAHSNDPGSIAPEVVAYSDTIEQVTLFSIADGGATRLVSVADHETGGLTLGKWNGTVDPSDIYPFVSTDANAPYPYIWRPDVLRAVMKSTEKMAQELTGSEGVIDFDQYYALATGVPYLYPFEEDKIRPIVNALQKCTSNCGTLQYHAEMSLGWPVSNRAQVGFSTHGHTGVDINLYAWGSATQAFAANMENTEVGQVVIDHLGLNETLAIITQELNDPASPKYVDRSAWDIARKYPETP
eukprot:CAMPEP_0113884036 /NCGR_PEP_ID=MMETSP0780_2-20120614/9984_1 /TAXON_ID=652834 /ORGANISM="Palpitomonas bilix" /LENGTH=494 /DNA_ID=CAMNT_0000871511 /DNA_START=138 /DNA_END=1623 /DNA_ORIENTATION=+ /assembly_acc=CAM_ASM_000599